jgi:signal transduction histidine kinase
MLVIDRHAELIREHRAALLASWREQVRRLPSASGLDAPALNDHIPQLIDEIADALQERAGGDTTDAVLEGASPEHGVQRLHDGFDIREVVGEYNILRGCLYELAEQHGVHIDGEAFHIMNRVIDEGIALAVGSYAEQQALEARRSKEKQVAFLAHDLRTPLNTISIAAQVLKGRLPEHQGEDESMLKIVERSVSRMQTLISDVIDELGGSAKSVDPQFAPRDVELWPIAEALVRDLQAVSGSVQVLNRVPRALTIHADPAMLGRILQNLLGNAVKFTPQGLVKVEARAIDECGGVECSVTDTGVGISAVRLDSLLEQGDSRCESTPAGRPGLGLAIVQHFVTLHAGRVSAESSPGDGTTFRFTLPGAGRDPAAQ